jgi:hypothetical protein
VPVFVILCIFISFLLSFIGWLVHRKFKQHQERKGLDPEDIYRREEEANRHVEMQIMGFLDHGLSGGNRGGRV